MKGSSCTLPLHFDMAGIGASTDYSIPELVDLAPFYVPIVRKLLPSSVPLRERPTIF